MSASRNRSLLGFLGFSLVVSLASGCGGGLSSAGSPSGSRADVARGGRLYDNWISEKKLKDSFKPDSAKTPELDGSGGPNGNGTLSDGTGKPLPNTGHDYRLKNLFGWDLRGGQGIYGASHQKKDYVLAQSLLEGARSEQQLADWLKNGDAEVPAYGAVLDERDLRDLAAFLVAVREHRVPRPDDVFTLDESAPKNYKLLPGADPKRGAATIAKRCSGCHGSKGTKFAIDDTESIGSISRSSAYEIWTKIANGQPGSPMKSQLLASDGDGAQRGKLVLDILAALCDRQAFPKLDNGSDVPDGDVRCGEYLR
ncbi:MAG: cytochrome c [Myxococcota bacterium]|nr:cytochrome c [Myxococcota bacterium]